MSLSEQARHWAPAGLPGLDLLRARYVAKTFPWHTHDRYVIAAVSRGVEEFRHRGAVERAGPGGLVMINPEIPHTGHAGVPEGWTYHALYPRPEVVARIMAETRGMRGTPAFSTAVTHDPEAVRLVAAVHRAAEASDMLTADTLLHAVVARLMRRHGTENAARTVPAAGRRVAAAARATLLASMTTPPALADLAAGLGTGPHALLRAFKDAYGMPPHAWLTDARVRRASELLDSGATPADAAATVGFVDQAHLTRHFSRIVGVPPGAYRRERLAQGEVRGRGAAHVRAGRRKPGRAAGAYRAVALDAASEAGPVSARARVVRAGAAGPEARSRVSARTRA